MTRWLGSHLLSLQGPDRADAFLPLKTGLMAAPSPARRLKDTLLDALGIRDLPFYLLNLKQLFVQSGIGQPIIYILLFSIESRWLHLHVRSPQRAPPVIHGENLPCPVEVRAVFTIRITCGRGVLR